jgi:transposase
MEYIKGIAMAIWLMRKETPDHKTTARFRKENSAALKNVFKDFVKLCIMNRTIHSAPCRFF